MLLARMYYSDTIVVPDMISLVSIVIGYGIKFNPANNGGGHESPERGLTRECHVYR